VKQFTLRAVFSAQAFHHHRIACFRTTFVSLLLEVFMTNKTSAATA